MNQNPIHVDPTAVRLKAFELWMARGCPAGSPELDWFEAERSLVGTDGGKVTTARAGGSDSAGQLVTTPESTPSKPAAQSPSAAAPVPTVSTSKESATSEEAPAPALRNAPVNAEPEKLQGSAVSTTTQEVRGNSPPQNGRNKAAGSKRRR